MDALVSDVNAMITEIGAAAADNEIGGDALRALQNEGAALVLKDVVSAALLLDLSSPFSAFWARYREGEVMPAGVM